MGHVLIGKSQEAPKDRRANCWKVQAWITNIAVPPNRDWKTNDQITENRFGSTAG